MFLFFKYFVNDNKPVKLYKIHLCCNRFIQAQKKPAKEDLPAMPINNGFITAILKSPFQTREAITFPF
jgi:hypothetical protein